MTEIDKMFENAGIEPVDYKLEPMGTLKFSVDVIGNTWTREQYMKEVPIYLPFTAEKQLELLKICFDKYERLEKVRGLKEEYSFTGGVFIGWSDALHWVLEDNEDVENN